VEAVVRVGQVGLGYWGKNLVRNFDDLAELTWLCDAEEETHAARAPLPERARDRLVRGDARGRRGRGGRDRHARPDALRAREAGARGRQARVRREAAGDARAEMEELVALAEERELVLMPGHLLLYHPACAS
jgi:hypothetical protein